MTVPAVRVVPPPTDDAPEPEPHYDDQPPQRGLPPQAVEAERWALGGMLLSPDAVAGCVEVVRGADFYRPQHEIIFDAIVDLFGAGEVIDAVTVADYLTKRGDLDRVGGLPALFALSEGVAAASSAPYYAKIVAERAVLRRVIEAGTKITELGYRGGDVADIVTAVQAAAYEVSAGAKSSEDYRPLSDVVNETVDEVEAAAGLGDGLAGLPTGFLDLDAMTQGMHPGQMIVIAARPAVGKSTLAIDIARAAAIDPDVAAPTAIFSLEMSRTEIGMRILSAEASIQLQSLRSGHLSDDAWRRLVGVMPQLEAAPLYIDDSPRLTMPEIRAKCRQLKATKGLKLVIVDYLQLMSSGKKVESRQQEVSEFSRALKLLAKELQVPVVALSQLNRGPEQRTDKKPMMSDLRESGSIEQDADGVWMLHRDDLYDKESPRAGEADIIIAKQRNGPTGTVTVAFQGHYSRFTNMASEF